MNAIAVIILVALVAEFLLQIFSDLLNLRHSTTALPESFQDIYDRDRYAESQKYLKVNTHFGWIDSGVSLIILLCFWFIGGFNRLDILTREIGNGPVISGLIFIGTLLIVRAVVDLPFSIYHTFVIEERFGFNKTDRKTFILDRLKGLCIAVILGGSLLAGVLAFFEYAGKDAWWYCWIAVTVFMLFIRFIAPTWIMPLFNKFTPLEDGDLRKQLMDYAKKIRFPLKNVFLMDGSRRSSKSNAFFTGFGGNKRIVLFDTLVSHTTVPELVAVMGHEMGHYKLKHIWTGTLIGILHAGILFYLLSLFLSVPALFEAFFMDTPSVYAGLIFFGMLFSPIELVLGILMQLHSRRNEFQADRFAVETTGNPKALSEALKKLSVRNLANLTPHPFYVFLNYSHPPILNRLEGIEKIELKDD